MKAALALILLASPVLADEVWMTDDGAVIYEADVGDVAVLSFPYGDGRANLYVEGLPGAMDQRDTHDGYWIADGAGSCSASLTGPDGLASNHWGSAIITFDRKVFPSGFIATMGECAYQGVFLIMSAVPG